MKKTVSILLTALISIILLSSCGINKKTPVSKTDFFFDTVITITLYDSDDVSIIDHCFDLCEEYENKFSRTITSSEISQLNTTGHAENLSEDTISILQDSIKYSEMTNGKFDITVAPLSELWDFTGDSPHVPDKNDIITALSSVNYKNISIEGSSVNISPAQTQVDLGGIAKGYIADKLKEYLISVNVNSALIDLGGNILMIGSKPDNLDYTIGIQKPFEERNNALLYVQGKDLSVVTSGVYERYFYENNILYHHILDTNTGYPCKTGLLSVTVISDSSTSGDALSTSCLALGLDDGLKLINSLDNVEAVFVDENYNIITSNGINIQNNIVTISSF